MEQKSEIKYFNQFTKLEEFRLALQNQPRGMFHNPALKINNGKDLLKEIIFYDAETCNSKKLTGHTCTRSQVKNKFQDDELVHLEHITCIPNIALAKMLTRWSKFKNEDIDYTQLTEGIHFTDFCLAEGSVGAFLRALWQDRLNDNRCNDEDERQKIAAAYQEQMKALATRISHIDQGSPQTVAFQKISNQSKWAMIALALTAFALAVGLLIAIVAAPSSILIAWALMFGTLGLTFIGIKFIGGSVLFSDDEQCVSKELAEKASILSGLQAEQSAYERFATDNRLVLNTAAEVKQSSFNLSLLPIRRSPLHHVEQDIRSWKEIALWAFNWLFSLGCRPEPLTPYEFHSQSGGFDVFFDERDTEYNRGYSS